MKGSPILSTIIAIFLMAVAYTYLEFSRRPPSKVAVNQSPSSSDQDPDSPRTQAYLEAHFSSPPVSFSVIDPLDSKVIASETSLSDIEWSSQISIQSSSDSVDLIIQAEWDSALPDDHQHFIQLILSPDQLADSSITLRNDSNVDDIATFTLSQ